MLPSSRAETQKHHKSKDSRLRQATESFLNELSQKNLHSDTRRTEENKPAFDLGPGHYSHEGCKPTLHYILCFLFPFPSSHQSLSSLLSLLHLFHTVLLFFTNCSMWSNYKFSLYFIENKQKFVYLSVNLLNCRYHVLLYQFTLLSSYSSPFQQL